jgi:hypothetical protein
MDGMINKERPKLDAWDDKNVVLVQREILRKCGL